MENKLNRAEARRQIRNVIDQTLAFKWAEAVLMEADEAERQLVGLHKELSDVQAAIQGEKNQQGVMQEKSRLVQLDYKRVFAEHEQKKRDLEGSLTPLKSEKQKLEAAIEQVKLKLESEQRRYRDEIQGLQKEREQILQDINEIKSKWR